MDQHHVQIQGIRKPVVAGLFYPEETAPLREMLSGFLHEARREREAPAAPPKALIVPHAGYPYSGPVAASGYVQLDAARETIKRVILLGPAHRYGFHGLAVCSAAHFETPLGVVDVDTHCVRELIEAGLVQVVDQAHRREHSLEVHLPFLQAVLNAFQVVPIVVGQVAPEEVSAVLRSVWGGAETLIVVSSDLSHFHDDQAARRIDRQTSRLIESGRGDRVSGDRACGHLAIEGLLETIRDQPLSVRTVDLRNSSETAGTPGRVVGYGAYVVEDAVRETPALAGPEDTGEREPPGPVLVPFNSLWGSQATSPFTSCTLAEESPEPRMTLSDEDQRILLKLAFEAIHHELASGKVPEVDPAASPLHLLERRATFVTLKKQGELRGCVGTVTAEESLLASIARSAGNAAFRDRRFRPLGREELLELEMHISILNPPERIECLTEADLVVQLRPGADGVTLREGALFGLFLPSVWEQVPHPAEFVRRLKQKAGFAPGYWSNTLLAERFSVTSFEGRLLPRNSDA